MNYQDINTLSVDDFDAFYREAHGRPPFAWQSRLASEVCATGWPRVIKLPTASGKTSVIDIAVFALAILGKHREENASGMIRAHRRIFFVVDRRVVVNEAYLQSRRLANRLRMAFIESSDNRDSSVPSVLQRVALRLQSLTMNPTAPPLDCFELRGGTFRNDSWVRSVLQPTILTSTVDQVGSRMLFRGYGVSDRNLSIHAALTSNDCLIILDEAHCSKAFAQTIQRVARYRSDSWVEHPLNTPFQFVEMTATPQRQDSRKNQFMLNKDDYASDPVLHQRHDCSKPVALLMARGSKGAKMVSELTKEFFHQAELLAAESGCKRIAMIVNRVDLAKEIYRKLNEKYAGRVDLMIGAMRPLDRDVLTEKIQKEFGTTSSQDHLDIEPRFLVATQCIEVGADFDFDGMITQTASLDSLRQRFGRLNRLGKYFHARGVIVQSEDDFIPKEKMDDIKLHHPIYGASLAMSWHFLDEHASLYESDTSKELKWIDFGVIAMDALLSGLETVSDLHSPSVDAQVLMPAHIDLLCQTNPRPYLEPKVSGFLHGPDREDPEIRVCWRADLAWTGTEEDEKVWSKAVAACPPSIGELMPVRLSVFRRWLSGKLKSDDSADVIGATVIVEENEYPNHDTSVTLQRRALIWRGVGDTDATNIPDSHLLDRHSLANVRSNDIVVIPVHCGGWEQLGHIPSAPRCQLPSPAELEESLQKKDTDGPYKELWRDLSRLDIADIACLVSRGRTIFRAHPRLCHIGQEAILASRMCEEFKNSKDGQREGNWSLRYWRDQQALELLQASSSEHEPSRDKLPGTLERLTTWNSLGRVDGKISLYPGGAVWVTEVHQTLLQSIERLPELTFDGDDLNESRKVSLRQHCSDVKNVVSKYVGSLSVSLCLQQTLCHAAWLHDFGKADPRFQARLRGRPVSTVFMLPELLAKSEAGREKLLTNPLPSGFRHEIASLELLPYYALNERNIDVDLLFHLVSSHHGYARPFVPVCVDVSPEVMDLRSLEGPIVRGLDRQRVIPAHRIDSGLCARFWKLTRRYGWWGLSWLESLLRLADWEASANPGIATNEVNHPPLCESPLAPCVSEINSVIPLDGLDGSSPLGFLAALGTFRIATLRLNDWRWNMRWEISDGAWRPRLIAFGQVPIDVDCFLEILLTSLAIEPDKHPILELLGGQETQSTAELFAIAASMSSLQDRELADWLTCNGSDLLGPDAISQLQTTRRDYHPINVHGLLRQTTKSHLVRTLFSTWDYGDPIQGVSLHLEPREDRRHAYQWHTPSGDPTRASSGGMIGANRLALEAWPLFQSIPDGQRLRTIGFHGTRTNNTRFRWCLWSKPMDLDCVKSLLSHPWVHQSDTTQELMEMGIPIVFSCSRILVGKTPNLTPAEPV
jgi:CRISPR-associated endonuclease/helicase Cas3